MKSGLKAIVLIERLHVTLLEIQILSGNLPYGLMHTVKLHVLRVDLDESKMAFFTVCELERRMHQ